MHTPNARRVRHGEAHDVTDPVGIDPRLDRRDQHHVQPDSGAILDGPPLEPGQGAPPQGEVGRIVRSVELEVDS